MKGSYIKDKLLISFMEGVERNSDVHVPQGKEGVMEAYQPLQQPLIFPRERKR